MGVVSVTPRPLFAPEKGPPGPIVQKDGWASEPVWTQGLKEKSFAPAGDRTPIARSSSPSQTVYWLSYPGFCFYHTENAELPQAMILCCSLHNLLCVIAVVHVDGVRLSP
jgi:hypothetical protein